MTTSSTSFPVFLFLLNNYLYSTGVSLMFSVNHRYLTFSITRLQILKFISIFALKLYSTNYRFYSVDRKLNHIPPKILQQIRIIFQITLQISTIHYLLPTLHYFINILCSISFVQYSYHIGDSCSWNFKNVIPTCFQ